MKRIVVIGDEEFVVGFSLAGCEGYIENKSERVLRLVKELIEKGDVGLILLDERVIGEKKKEIQELKMKSTSTIIYEVPGPGSAKKTEDYRKLIRQILGF
ncbi:MAG TPA: V-type ATP synthase subunit F [Geobacterales bacterium]|nr:V-type ATP synthase subunit F [Geobacterales bacterium]